MHRFDAAVRAGTLCHFDAEIRMGTFCNFDFK
jgi:hypothetical protein